jgi:ubiquinone/menaquinone biosynthesis C-methylase UbiE
VNVPDKTRRLYDVEAANYASRSDIKVPGTTRKLYSQEIASALGGAAGRKALDVGTGTGFLAGLLLKLGYRVWGADSSPNMLKQAKKKYRQAHFATFDVERSSTRYARGSFDVIISRQVVCHFVNPITTFGIWYRWLRPAGYVVVIDAFWRRKDWIGNWRQLVDHLPLACTETCAPVCYMLTQAGFSIKAAGLMDLVNKDERRRSRSAAWKPKERYMVAAQKV